MKEAKQSEEKSDLSMVEEYDDEEDSDPSMVEEWNSEPDHPEEKQSDQMMPYKKVKRALYPLEDTIDVENPYLLHLQDTRYVWDELFLFGYPELDIEAHRRRMAGRMVRTTSYECELRITRPAVWVIDLHDEGKSNLVGYFEIWGITVFVWLNHRYYRRHRR